MLMGAPPTLRTATQEKTSLRPKKPLNNPKLCPEVISADTGQFRAQFSSFVIVITDKTSRAQSVTDTHLPIPLEMLSNTVPVSNSHIFEIKN